MQPTSRIKSQAVTTLIALWVFGIISGAAGFLDLYFTGLHDIWAAVAFLFCIAGVASLVAAIVKTLREFRFRSVLVLDTDSARVGATLRGHIEMANDPHARRIIGRLSWLQDRPDRDDSSDDRIVWQGEVALSPVHAASGVRLPVEFIIPADVEATGNPSFSQRNRWRIEIDCERARGGYYRARFAVPVARADPAKSNSDSWHTAKEPLVHTIPIEQTSRGLEMYFAPFRARGHAAIYLAVILVFGVLVIPMIMYRAPWPGVVILCMLDLFCIGFALDLFFARSRAIIGKQTLSVERRLIFSSRRTVPITDVKSAVPLVGGLTNLGGQQTFYNLTAFVTDGKPLILGERIPNRGEAEWLALEVRKRLPAKSETAQ